MSSKAPSYQYNAKGVRSGKFRHIYGDPAPTAKRYRGLCKHLTAGESDNVCANGKYFAIPLGIKTPGAVYIQKLSEIKKFNERWQLPLISVQSKKVLDLQFSPFIDNVIATGSEDCSIAITQFPKNGLIKNIKNANAYLKGHTKKIVLNRFNNSVNNIIASASFDKSIKIWDINKQSCINTYNGFKDNIQSMEWNYEGSMIGGTSKDKTLQIFDPRDNKTSISTESFDGIKSSKIFWIPNLSWIGSTGFSKKGQRMMKFWDIKNMSKILHEIDLGNQFQILMPKYDNDLGIIYLYEKGGQTIWYGEIINDNKKYYPIKLYRDNSIQKGGCWIEKRYMNTKKCQVMKFVKITKDSVIPVTFYCPRKTGEEVFQEDIYPDCLSGKPSLESDEWIKGENKPPLLMDMNPSKRTDINDNDNDIEFKVDTNANNDNNNKSAKNNKLSKENALLKQKIKELETENENLKAENKKLKFENDELKKNKTENEDDIKVNENTENTKNDDGWENVAKNDDDNKEKEVDNDDDDDF